VLYLNCSASYRIPGRSTRLGGALSFRAPLPMSRRLRFWGSQSGALLKVTTLGRIRTIKPEFFKHADLFDLEQETGINIRIAFAGLWSCCDREGRFKWRPRELKVDILPYDDCDFSRVLDALATRGFVVKYTLGTEVFGYIPTWKSHQFINNKEPQSNLPNPHDCQQVDASVTREYRVDDASSTRGVKEGNGREWKGMDSCAEASPAPALDENQQPIALSTNTGESWIVPASDCIEWAKAFPALNVLTELLHARAWLNANPKNRKTASGMKRFIVSWLGRAQNSARADKSQERPMLMPQGLRPDVKSAESYRKTADAVDAENQRAIYEWWQKQPEEFRAKNPWIQVQ
jgi:hypothetical protein